LVGPSASSEHGYRLLIIILEELKSWFGPIEDASRRERNPNFLQNCPRERELAVISAELMRSQEVCAEYDPARLISASSI
jgi:hypothetical protein